MFLDETESIYRNEPRLGYGVAVMDADGDGALSVDDFVAFQTAFAVEAWYADCDRDGVYTVADFGCFQGAFARGCD